MSTTDEHPSGEHLDDLVRAVHPEAQKFLQVASDQVQKYSQENHGSEKLSERRIGSPLQAEDTSKCQPHRQRCDPQVAIQNRRVHVDRHEPQEQHQNDAHPHTDHVAREAQDQDHRCVAHDGRPSSCSDIHVDTARPKDVLDHGVLRIAVDAAYLVVQESLVVDPRAIRHGDRKEQIIVLQELSQAPVDVFPCEEIGQVEARPVIPRGHKDLASYAAALRAAHVGVPVLLGHMTEAHPTHLHNAIRVTTLHNPS
mmetsp:Transcript_76035/g.246792  ORF Transcript_76035/g.246792 Transcript_76035/m.246792 type:complete len:254 (+) Transcript_76035:776-1537(+)